jgi:hypothetical protein
MAQHLNTCVQASGGGGVGATSGSQPCAIALYLHCVPQALENAIILAADFIIEKKIRFRFFLIPSVPMEHSLPLECCTSSYHQTPQSTVSLWSVALPHTIKPHRAQSASGVLHFLISSNPMEYSLPLECCTSSSHQTPWSTVCLWSVAFPHLECKFLPLVPT